MNKFDRAAIARRTIFKVPPHDWTFEITTGAIRAVFDRSALHISIWRPLNLPDDQSIDCKTFLEQCFWMTHGHMVDVWIDGIGKIMSVECTDESLNVIGMRRGDWETDFFRFPVPKGRGGPGVAGAPVRVDLQ